jgi:hypothetical protein
MMEDSLYSLAYISKNTITGDQSVINMQIANILVSAQNNNPSKGVTGALLYSGGYFCQVIEGPEVELEELFELIQMDDRHSECTILHFEPIDERGFSDWSMAFAGIDDKMRFDIDGIKASKDELAMRDAGKNLAKVLDELVTQRQSVST